MPAQPKRTYYSDMNSSGGSRYMGEVPDARMFGTSGETGVQPPVAASKPVPPSVDPGRTPRDPGTVYEAQGDDYAPAAEPAGSGFGDKLEMGVDFAKDNFADLILPLMGVIESLATKGEGTAAKEAIKSSRMRESAKEDMKQKRLAGELAGVKGKAESDKVAHGQEYQEKVKALFADQSLSEADRQKMGMALYEEYFPEQASGKRLESTLKKEETGIKAGLEFDKAKLKAELEKAGSKFDQEKKLRDKFFDQSKDYIQVRDAYNKIKAVSPTAMGDHSLIFGYMKMIDPGSTVREGEFAQVGKNTNVPGWVANIYNKALKGTRLNDPQRNDLLARVEELYGGQKKGYDTLESQYTSLAHDYGLDSNNVVGGVSPSSTITPEDREALTWAQANTGDPKAEQILTILRDKYPGAL